MLYLQDLIQKLTQYWADQGCATHFGYDLEMGAGTFNPVTFFRSLGPEPYHAAYLEPSRRPSDGRYGSNPSRMQHFLQFQVILKPSPLDIQALYLGSLKALGLTIEEHDIRFVHDDWKSPTLGAWGLGWEVWVDGMEASQFTYFQQFGGLELDVIPGELTYGLERLAMYIQGIDNVYELKWNADLTYGDIYHQNEVEWSTYNFDESSVNLWQTSFEMYEREALSLIEKKLPIPAYDFVMKASHAFNMLDARGVISVTERAAYINRVRSLACRVATIFCEHRQEIGHPLAYDKNAEHSKPAPIKLKPQKSNGADDFVLEIRVEELPHSFVPSGIKELKKQFTQLLDQNNLSYSKVQAYGSPRRLSVYIEDLAKQTSEETTEKKGPAVEKAFDNLGQLTPIGSGFIKSLGFDECRLKDIYEGQYPQLSIKEVKKQPYLFVTLVKKSQSTLELFNQELPKLILSLNFPQKMWWSDLKIAFPRPIRSFLALHGDELIPFNIGPYKSSDQTDGHPLLSPQKFTVGSATNYLSELKKHHIILDQDARKADIESQLKSIEKQYNAKATHVNEVLPQVLHLCESPHLIVGSFDEKFLELPSELIELVLITHQRHFPLQDHHKKLLPHYVICLDTEPNDKIKKGHIKAVTPRLADGLFLYHQDLKTGLKTLSEKLKEITFQQEHGSLAQKAQRLHKLARYISQSLSFSLNDDDVDAATHLLKADLASNVVFEFPELQGLMGKVYAAEEHFNDATSQAIEEHWLPRYEEDRLPSTPLGIVCSLSDKIDNILACFLVGQIPSSSSDPFALRRQTLGIIRILIENKLSLALQQMLEQAKSNFDNQTNPKAIEQILTFVKSRLKTVLSQYQLRPDEIQAVLAASNQNLDIYDIYLRAQSLHQFKGHELFSPLFEVYKRAKGQLNTEVRVDVDESLFCTEQEKDLYHYFKEIKPQFHSCVSEKLYSESFHLLATLHPFLSSLFDHVKIMDQDERLRMNRLALLNQILQLFNTLFDFSLVVES